jgi:hypothetical protein
MDNALADAFLQHALDIAPEDPDVLHEMGVLKYQSGEYGIVDGVESICCYLRN